MHDALPAVASSSGSGGEFSIIRTALRVGTKSEQSLYRPLAHAFDDADLATLGKALMELSLELRLLKPPVRTKEERQALADRAALAKGGGRRMSRTWQPSDHGLTETQLDNFAKRCATLHEYIKRLRECERAGIPFTIAEQFPAHARPTLALVSFNAKPSKGSATAKRKDRSQFKPVLVTVL